MDEEVFKVGMGEYAYIDNDVVEDRGVYALETPGISYCFGVGFYSRE